MANLIRPIVLACLLLVSAPSVWACGDDGQTPCGGDCEWYVRGYCPFCIPWCSRNPYYCHQGMRQETQMVYLWTGEVVEQLVCRKTVIPPPPPPPPPAAPAIDVKELPSRINIGTETLNGMEGYYALIDIDKVDFVAPESDRVSPNNQYVVDLNGNSRPKTCTDINQKGGEGKVWKDALLNLTDWHALYPVQLLVNGNWFDVADPFVSPNVNLCTNMFGYAVANGRQVTAASATDRGNLLDALLLIATKKSNAAFAKATIVSNTEIAQYDTPQFAVAGFVILKNGVAQNTPTSNSPDINFSRTAVGLSADGKKMTVVVEQRGKFLNTKAGLTAVQMAGLMKYFGADTAINLDNSGSSQLAYYEKSTDSAPKYISKKGDMVLDCNQPLRVPCSAEEKHLDDEGDLVLRYRPVPNFLGIKTKP